MGYSKRPVVALEVVDLAEPTELLAKVELHPKDPNKPVMNCQFHVRLLFDSLL